VFVCSPNRLRRLRKLGICEGAKCDANEFWHTAWFPTDVRSAANAEVKLDGKATRRIAFEAISSPTLDFDHVLLIENRDAECTPSSPLAIEAVAHRDLSWAAVTQQFDISAMASGCARFHKFWPSATLNRHFPRMPIKSRVSSWPSSRADYCEEDAHKVAGAAAFAPEDRVRELALSAWSLVHGYATLCIEVALEPSARRGAGARLFAHVIRTAAATASGQES
jgi:hypothetical protein